MNVERIDHISIGIPENSVEKALKFYRGALGFETFKLEEFRDGERTSFFFRMGENALLNLRPKEEFRELEQEN
ncbi:MAG: VOC family protein, partial [Candidatus Nanohalobium sp.]